MNGVGFLGAIVIGILAGWVAAQVTHREQDVVTNMIVGLVGALLGGLLASMLDLTFVGFWGSLVVSTIGAIVLLAFLDLFRRRGATRG